MMLNRGYSLITGATSGIGKEFALYFASKSYNLVLTGRREKELEDFRVYLKSTFGVEVYLVIGDFSEEETFEKIFALIEGKNIKYLINNVGYGNKKSFFSQTIEEALKMVRVQVDATVKLCHRIIPLMQEDAYVINVSSLAAYLPTPYNQIYAGTKNFLVVFSESLNFYLRDKKIKVKVLLPGFTKTEFHRYTSVVQKSYWMSSEKVIFYTMKELKKDKILIIPGILNKAVYILAKTLPKRILYYFLKKEKEL